MKTGSFYKYLYFMPFLGLLAITGKAAPYQAESLNGSWQLVSLKENGEETQPGHASVATFTDGYFVRANYNVEEKEFLDTEGGTYTVGDKLSRKYEFSSKNKERVRQNEEVGYNLEGDKLLLTIDIDGIKKEETWEKLGEGDNDSPLFGTWRISGRRDDEGNMNAIQPGPRKTLKILSDGRFQWIAMNTETGEFFGTGGGTYELEDGKYIENIEFFSRDSSRVGQQLSFNYEVKDGDWHHSGKSSAGKDIYEVWKKEN